MISKLEEVDQDAPYFFIKTGLVDVVNDLDTRENPSMSKQSSNEKMFWERVDPDLIPTLYNHYILDFEMFDYSVVDYFQSLGLPTTNFESLFI